MATSDPAVMSAATERTRYWPSSGLIAVLGAAMVVATVGLFIGPLRFLRHGGAPWVNLLPTTFNFWDTQPLASHLLLAFPSPEDIEQGRAYTSYSPLWLLLLYAFLKPLRWLGLPYERSQVALCLPHFAAIVVLLAAHLRHVRACRLVPIGSLEQFRLFVCALAVAGVLTLPSFWIPFFRFNPEQYFFLPALVFCYFAAADYRGAIQPRDGVAALGAIALLAPLFTPFATLSWLVLWELRLPVERSRRSLRWLGAITLIGVAIFLLPRALVHLTAFSGTGSGFLFRSGLDGSEQYFTSMIQAVWAPSYAPGRAWHLFQWPVAAFGAIAAAAMVYPKVAARMLRQLFICCIPFLWMVIVFPQWVSIHPYFFDFHIALGSAFCLAFWIQQPELDRWLGAPAIRLVVLMMWTALLMTNLIDLARIAS